MRDGMLLLNKPRGLTSHDVVQVLRRKLGCQKIGHTGTLDPAADGLLILLIGTATRHQQALQGHEKTYEGCIRLGVQTDTADAAGQTIRSLAVPPLRRELLQETLASLLGTISQVPPSYSAIKVRGRPAYWWARRHGPITLPPRTVHIHEFGLLGFDSDRIHCRIRCSAGTYIRSLAESVAERLGTVGHLETLTRMQVGSCSLADAMQLEWVRQASADDVYRCVRPVFVASALSVG